MGRKKKKQNNLKVCEWGDLHVEVTINKCPKCSAELERIPAFGIVSLSVCSDCKKFYALKIEDVTKHLSSKFKKEHLEDEAYIDP